MLKLNSLFWASKNRDSICAKLEKIGFKVTSSHRYPENKAVYFGPDAIELMTANEKTSEGIIALEFESDDISGDYKEFSKKFPDLAKPMIGKNNSDIIWYGFYLPASATPGFESWVIMTSPEEMRKFDGEVLPFKHSNSAHSYESVSFSVANASDFTKKWASVFDKPESGLSWNELQKVNARRVLMGQKFIDAVEMSQKSQGAFMLTVRVADLELAKEICVKAGVKLSPCESRDGFLLDAGEFEGITIRFVRQFWQKYLPLTKKHFPYYRREDGFRSLGGTLTSTLEQGFKDDWSF